MSERLLTVATYWSQDEAETAASALETAGINVHLHDENIVRLNWMEARAFDGIKLRIEEEQAIDAVELLGGEVTVEDFDAGAPPWSAGEILCTTCGSEDVYLGLNRRRRLWIWYIVWMPLIMGGIAFRQLFLVVLLWALGPFFILMSERWRCRVCGTSWPGAKPPRPKYASPPAPAAPA